MELTLLYDTGNEPAKTACDMLRYKLTRMNPKFEVKAQAVDFSSYIDKVVQGSLPMFMINWIGDYPDPHSFVFPFMHSQGTGAKFQGYSNPEVDKLIQQGISTIEEEKRAQIYDALRDIYHEEVISIPLHQPLLRRYERGWIKGWYHNPMFSQAQYVYPLQKGY